MRKPMILVSAAAGKTGSATAKLLLEKGYPVRALVRRADARSEQLRALGAEIAVGSLEDIADLRASLAGVQRAYFCPPLEPGTLRRASLFAAAAQDAKLEAVVVLSQWLADPLHPAVHAREKWLTQRVFEWIPGVDVTTVNPGFFADNYMVALEPIAQFGLMAMPLGGGLNAPPSNEDIARVVVGALTDPARHAGEVYRPTGPRLLAPDEIAAAIGRALGRPVRYQNAPMRLFLKVAKSLGVSDFVIEELHWFLLDYQRNSFGVGAPTDAVLEVGGAPPESFEEIARRYVAASPFAARTLGSRLGAVGNLLKGLLTPAPDPESIARRLEIPRPAHTALAADSSDWNRSHGAACPPGPVSAGPVGLELR
ncbi:MAG TPA: NmrA family NAD(P)-binding protein [Myxococcota bacterium]|nr:NmrA family NAD(P)-binding protein [Myxococcota bacterium]